MFFVTVPHREHFGLSSQRKNEPKFKHDVWVKFILEQWSSFLYLVASLFKEEKHNPNSKKPLVIFCHIMFEDFCIFGMDVNLLTKQIIWSKDSLNMDF